MKLLYFEKKYSFYRVMSLCVWCPWLYSLRVHFSSFPIYSWAWILKEGCTHFKLRTVHLFFLIEAQYPIIPPQESHTKALKKTKTFYIINASFSKCSKRLTTASYTKLISKWERRKIETLYESIYIILIHFIGHFLFNSQAITIISHFHIRYGYFWWNANSRLNY